MKNGRVAFPDEELERLLYNSDDDVLDLDYLQDTDNRCSELEEKFPHDLQKLMVGRCKLWNYSSTCLHSFPDVITKKQKGLIRTDRSIKLTFQTYSFWAIIPI